MAKSPPATRARERRQRPERTNFVWYVARVRAGVIHHGAGSTACSRTACVTMPSASTGASRFSPAARGRPPSGAAGLRCPRRREEHVTRQHAPAVLAAGIRAAGIPWRSVTSRRLNDTTWRSLSSAIGPSPAPWTSYGAADTLPRCGTPDQRPPRATTRRARLRSSVGADSGRRCARTLQRGR